VVFTLEHHTWLTARATNAHPFEVCGFIMRDGSIIEIRNLAKNPRHYFRMDLRQIGRTVDTRAISAIWHTHPNGDVRPSQKDLEAIRLCDWGYVIATEHEVVLYGARKSAFWDGFIEDRTLNLAAPPPIGT
jgi:proteasome lid subunit RPN8/RPN11